MRKIRDVLRLYFEAALSVRAIARSLGTSPSTVGEYLRRAKVAGLSWPVPESVDDAGLERRLFPAPPPSRAERPLPDWSEVHRELRRKSVTLALLWQEYKESHPEGLQYDRYLAAGYPIATGVVEGACRHLVRDRMELTGARWRLVGAEAVLKLRALRASGDFDAYWDFHEAREYERNHAQRYADGIVPPVTEPPPPPSSPSSPRLRRVK